MTSKAFAGVRGLDLKEGDHAMKTGMHACMHVLWQLVFLELIYAIMKMPRTRRHQSRQQIPRE